MIRDDGTQAEFSRTGVVELAAMLDVLHHYPKVAGQEIRPWILFFASAFLGECLLASAGGRWLWHEEMQEWSIRFGDSEEGLSCFPRNQVRKHVTNGSADDIVTYYDTSIAWREWFGVLDREQIPDGSPIAIVSHRYPNPELN
jgi:hypothetical protein